MPKGIYKRKGGWKMTLEQRETNSRVHKGLNHWMKGRKMSEETRLKMKASKIANREKHHLWKGGISGRERKLFLNRQRRARKLNTPGSYTQGEWEDLKIQYGFTCPCCKRKEPTIKLTEDHIIPLSKGGSNFIENIQPLCKSCNSRKHAKLIPKYQLD